MTDQERLQSETAAEIAREEAHHLANEVADAAGHEAAEAAHREAYWKAYREAYAAAYPGFLAKAIGEPGRTVRATAVEVSPGQWAVQDDWGRSIADGFDSIGAAWSWIDTHNVEMRDRIHNAA